MTTTRMTSITEDNRFDIRPGASVRLYPAYGTGTKHFVCYLGGVHVLIADTKRDCMNGDGYIYSIHAVKAFRNAY